MCRREHESVSESELVPGRRQAAPENGPEGMAPAGGSGSRRERRRRRGAVARAAALGAVALLFTDRGEVGHNIALH